MGLIYLTLCHINAFSNVGDKDIMKTQRCSLRNVLSIERIEMPIAVVGWLPTRLVTQHPAAQQFRAPNQTHFPINSVW